jgi:hypothetical protein
MRKKSTSGSSSSERLVKSIRGATRKQYSPEEKIPIVLDGLRGDRARGRAGCPVAALVGKEGAHSRGERQHVGGSSDVSILTGGEMKDDGPAARVAQTMDRDHRTGGKGRAKPMPSAARGGHDQDRKKVGRLEATEPG